MTISFDLQPEVELGLSLRAQAQGVSLSEYVQQIVIREAHPLGNVPGRTGQELIDISARVRGLLTDAEVDTLFARNPSPSRLVDFA